MKFRLAALAMLTAFLFLTIPQIAHAELKLAILKVKGMVCAS